MKEMSGTIGKNAASLCAHNRAGHHYFLAAALNPGQARIEFRPTPIAGPDQAQRQLLAQTIVLSKRLVAFRNCVIRLATSWGWSK
jgi:hypothetical protein